MEYQREELSFYTNQCLDEVRRTGRDNGRLLSEHYIEMAQVECAYVNQHHIMWADFLSHFTEIGQLEENQDPQAPAKPASTPTHTKSSMGMPRPSVMFDKQPLPGANYGQQQQQEFQYEQPPVPSEVGGQGLLSGPMDDFDAAPMEEDKED